MASLSLKNWQSSGPPFWATTPSPGVMRSPAETCAAGVVHTTPPSIDLDTVTNESQFSRPKLMAAEYATPSPSKSVAGSPDAYICALLSPFTWMSSEEIGTAGRDLTWTGVGALPLPWNSLASATPEMGGRWPAVRYANRPRATACDVPASATVATSVATAARTASKRM